MVRRIDNIGNTVWTAYFGDSHATAGKVSNSVGLSIVQVRTHITYYDSLPSFFKSKNVKFPFANIKSSKCSKSNGKVSLKQSRKKDYVSFLILSYRMEIFFTLAQACGKRPQIL